MENRTTSEKARKNDRGAIEVLGGIVPESEFVRVLEFAAEMRPDHAVALVNAIRIALGKIPPDRRSRYNIPPELLINQVAGSR
jgi:hypothetical protein